MHSVALSVAALYVLASSVAARGFDWVNGLPDCWQDCLEETKDGCDSKSCICDASQSSSYLTSAVTCAVTKCDGDDWSVSLMLLGPLQMYCTATGNSIPEDVMSSAYAACTATEAPAPTSHKVEHSSKPSSQKTTKGSGDLKSAVTSTITRTTTDKDGNTLQIIVPIAIGPSTVSTGKTVTSTLESEPSSTDGAVTISASSSPAPAAPAPTSTPVQQVATSSPASEPTQRTSNSNGSPFENMQAAASHWGFSRILIGLGFAVGLFMRL